MSEQEKNPLRLGGMALQNGLLLHSAKHWSAAIRRADGTIEVASGRKSSPLASEAAGRWPLARGLFRMADAMLMLPRVKAQLKEAQLPFESPKVAVSLALSALATAGVRRSQPRLGVAAREAASALLALAPAAIALKDSSVAQYHGAEHRSIGEFERMLRGEEPETATKEHERCGSNLVGPLLVTNALASVFLRRARGPAPQRALLAGVLSIGSAMEVFRWMSRHPGSPLARALMRPGHTLQRFLTTEEPTSAQMDVAHAALDEMLRMEGVEILREAEG